MTCRELTEALHYYDPNCILVILHDGQEFIVKPDSLKTDESGEVARVCVDIEPLAKDQGESHE